jgi:hypothetical protein
MVKKKFTLLIIVMVLLITLVSAIDYQQKDKERNIIHSVRTEGATTSTALCNLTLTDPINIIQVNFKSMSYNSNSQTFNYTVPGSNNTLLGEYCYDITCTDKGLNQTDTFCYTVNTVGKSYSIEESITYLFILLILCGIFGFLVFASIKIPFKNGRNMYGEIEVINWKKYLKLFSIGMSYLIFVSIIYLMWNLSYGYLQLRAVSTLFHYLYRILIGLILPIMTTIIIISGAIFLTDKKLMRAIERGVPVT